MSKNEHSYQEFLLINTSPHSFGSTKLLLDIAKDTCRKKKVSFKMIDLIDYKIDHCWGCYSNKEADCRYPCKNQTDDMPYLHKLILNAKGVIIATPIHWITMSSRLKVFLDRLTCIQNIADLEGKLPLAGRILGLIVVGHEDGVYKTANDIFVVFQNMGYILAPCGIAYALHNKNFKPETDYNFFQKDKKTKNDIEAVTCNVIELTKSELWKKIEIKKCCM